MNNIVALIREKLQLDEQIGMLSCLDFPNEYDKMDELAYKVAKQIEEIAQYHDVSQSGLETTIYNVAEDIEDGNISESADITFLTFDEFTEQLAELMNVKEAKRFLDMLGWMQPKDKVRYIETRFILEAENDRNNKKKYYYDDMMTFVIVVE